METLPVEPAPFDDFVVSPSGPLRMVVERPAEDGGESLWVVELESGVSNRLTFGDVGDNPWWHPSGDSVLYVDRSGNDSRLILRASDGSGVPRTLFREDGIRYGYPSASRAFDRVVFTRHSNEGVDLWVLDLDSGEAGPLVEEDGEQDGARVSPDGRFVAYIGDQISGEPRIYLEPMDPDGSRWDLSRGAALFPRWAPDGSAVYFFSVSGGILRVDISTEGGRISISNPQTVLAVDPNEFDVLPDGSGLIMTRDADAGPRSDGPDSRYVDVVFNWTQELKRLIPR